VVAAAAVVVAAVAVAAAVLRKGTNTARTSVGGAPPARNGTGAAAGAQASAAARCWCSLRVMLCQLHCVTLTLHLQPKQAHMPLWMRDNTSAIRHQWQVKRLESPALLSLCLCLPPPLLQEARGHQRQHKAGKDSSTSAAAAAAVDKALAFARLRAERLSREAQERTRALQATGQL
jgi:hypothetical protein